MYKLTLATDLDGTFFEGHPELKQAFYPEFSRLRDEVCLIYVTGRPIKVVEQFCKSGYLPQPHFIIGDHGTEVIDGSYFQILDALQNPIIEKWNASNTKIKDLLRGEPGLQLQPINPPYRVAYYYDPDLLQEATLQKIREGGFDIIKSFDMYLDIVPKGVGKGPTLLNLLAHLNIDHENVITAGDSLNDFSLFQTGLKGIAVGNSEPKLLAATKQLANVYQSELPGISGILDGLRFFGKDGYFNLFDRYQFPRVMMASSFLESP